MFEVIKRRLREQDYGSEEVKRIEKNVLKARNLFPLEVRKKVADGRAFTQDQADGRTAYACQDGRCVVGALLVYHRPGLDPPLFPSAEQAYVAITGEPLVISGGYSVELAKELAALEELMELNDAGFLDTPEAVRDLLLSGEEN